MTRVLKTFFCAAILIMLPSIGLYAGTEGSCDPMSSAATRAFQLSYLKFSGHISELDKDNSVFSGELSDINSYEVSLIRSEDGFEVSFKPRNVLGQTVYGGDATYVVDSSGTRIVRVEMFR